MKVFALIALIALIFVFVDCNRDRDVSSAAVKADTLNSKPAANKKPAASKPLTRLEFKSLQTKRAVALELLTKLTQEVGNSGRSFTFKSVQQKMNRFGKDFIINGDPLKIQSDLTKKKFECWNQYSVAEEEEYDTLFFSRDTVILCINKTLKAVVKRMKADEATTPSPKGLGAIAAIFKSKPAEK
ncbi:hypothetical protein AKO1_013308 [Acrasis kona]|uniref:Uncharacterized protein n=1 Tax=Acrasis kona TaxID=1008807 RepID=A0AAW2YYY8_9EUKA